jgi:hypothetical protein
MVWLLTDRLPVAALTATPPDTFTGLPKFVPSITNCTVPLGVPPPGPVIFTLAVKLRLWPETEEPAEELTNVLVVALLTV